MNTFALVTSKTWELQKLPRVEHGELNAVPQRLPTGGPGKMLISRLH